jgi:myo-inositol-1-phosphate synthase
MYKWNTKKDIWVHRTWKIEYNFADNFITVYKAQDNMKKEIKPAEGRLGVLVVGVGGAVSTTLIAGTLAAAKGLAKPIGSITQMATIKMEDGKEKQVRDIVPIANLKDIVFGGWDIFPENAYDAAMYAEVLKEKDLKGIKEEMEAIVPMPAAFDHNWAKRLNGTNIKKVTGRMDMVEQLRQDIRNFKAKNNCSRIVVLWAASTEIYIPESEAHQSLASLEKAMKENNTEVISPSMCYAYAAIAEGAPFIMGAPNLCVDIPAMWEFSKKQNVPIAGKDFKSGQTLMKTVLAPMFKTRMLGVSGWFSTNILGNRDGEVLDEPENFKTKEVSKLSVIDNIFEPEKFPDLYGDVYHKVRINYYPPRKDNKEAWDNIDIFGWMGYPMEIKVNFLCRDSILAAPIALDLVLFSDLAARAGMCGIQTWLSFFCKSPMHDKEHQPVHDLFTQWRIVKETIRDMVGEKAPSYLD